MCFPLNSLKFGIFVHFIYEKMNEFSFASFELYICVCVKVWFVKQFAVTVIIQNFTPYIITMQNGIWMAMTIQCVIEDQNSKFDIDNYI
jgi:hypothetical protein